MCVLGKHSVHTELPVPLIAYHWLAPINQYICTVTALMSKFAITVHLRGGLTRC